MSSPSLHLAVMKAWLTLPDWVSRRTEIVELEDASTASHKIVLDITLPEDLRRSLTIYPQQSDEWGTSKVTPVDPGGTEDGPGRSEEDDPSRNADEGEFNEGDPGASAERDTATAGASPENEKHDRRNGVVLLPALFLRRGMPLPRLSITLGEDEIKGTYLAKELSDALMQGIIALANDNPVPGPHQLPVQRFDCECPEAAWQCKKSSCPGRSEHDSELPNGDLKSCPPPTSPLRRYEWPYCPYAEDDQCTCVKERCPAAKLTPPDVIGPDDRSLASFLDSHLSTDYGMVIVAPESAVAGSFRLEIAFTRELTRWVRPHEVIEVTKPRTRFTNLLGNERRRKRRDANLPVARCGPFQGVVERAAYPRRQGLYRLRDLLCQGDKARRALREKAHRALRAAARQTDQLRSGWNRRKGFFHGRDWIRRTVATRGASMTIGVQTSSLGDAGTFHFVFGAPKGMQITPSGGWVHDWPAWRRENISEGISSLSKAEPFSELGSKHVKGYTDDLVPLVSDEPADEPNITHQASPAPFVSFIPARGIDEKVALRPTPADLLPLAPTSETKGPNRRFSPGSSLLALIQFRPTTNLPLYGILTNLLLLGIVLTISLLSDDQRATAFLDREDAWVSILILAPALLAGLTATREHPVAASLVFKYRRVLGLTAGLSLAVALFFLVTTDSAPGSANGNPHAFVPSLFDSSPSGWIFRALAGVSFVLLTYSIFHYAVNRAAHKWADAYPVNQLDLSSPTRGFKLDTMRRPWCDPSPIRPEQALGELEALRSRCLGRDAPSEIPDVSSETLDSRARDAGVDTLILSSQDLASTFTESKTDRSSGPEPRGRTRKKEMRTKEHLLEKYGVQLPEYIESETELTFIDGRFYERKIHDAIEPEGSGSGISRWVNLSPRHPGQLPRQTSPVMVPTAADDDLDRYLMTLAAMEAGVEVIAEGCLMGRYAPPTEQLPGTRWLEVGLRTASPEQIARFMEVLRGGLSVDQIRDLLEEPGKGSLGGLLGGWPAAPKDQTDWFQEMSRNLNEFQVARLLEALLRGGNWGAIAKELGGKGPGRWADLPEDSPPVAVRGLPTRRFKGFPDLLVRRDLIDSLEGDGEYVPIDIKQGDPLSTIGKAESKAPPQELISMINARKGHSVKFLDWYPISVTERNKKPQYLAQLGLYSVLSTQASETLLAYPRSAEFADAMTGQGPASKTEARKALREFRAWLSEDETFAEELAPRLTVCGESGDAALWTSRGNGKESRIIPIPGSFLSKELEKATRDLVLAQADVSSNPELAGWSGG